MSNTPSSSINGAPPFSPSGAPSSAGWKMNSTVPGNSLRIEASAWAVPIRIAVCASWPHACITPTFSPRYSAVTADLNGTSTCSFTGSASMSARSAITGPGLPPFSTPTTPVCATPVFTSSPSDFRCAATAAAVRVSRFPSSGFWWKSRRQSMTCGASFFATWSSWVSVIWALAAPAARTSTAATEQARRRVMAGFQWETRRAG